MPKKTAPYLFLSYRAWENDGLEGQNTFGIWHDIRLFDHVFQLIK